MLMSFAVKNFKSFKDWLEFDLTSSNKYEFNLDCVSNEIVKTVLVYGYNGVGKSNLGLAMFDIINHMTDKMVNKTFYANYQNACSNDRLVEFVYRFKFTEGQIMYEYGKTGVDEMVYERLTINGKEVVAYDRRIDGELTVSLVGADALNKNIAELKISAVKYVKSNTVLKVNTENTLFYNLCSFVDNMLVFWSLDSRSYMGYESSGNDILQDIISRNHINEFKEFLHESGVPDNVRVEESIGKKSIVFDFGDKTLDFFSNTSTGIRSLTLFYYWFQRMQSVNSAPSLIYIDEYDAFYHSRMAEFVVEKLKKLPIQVILTTHNSSLMTNELMRPDCCFLMYKDRILPLSKRIDKELRFAHNIEKMYKAGAFNE
jgi:AAA15 family ATPase/GTPase